MSSHALAAHYVNAAHAAIQAKQHAQAKQYGELALALNPGIAEAWFNLGLAEAGLKHREPALKALLRARDLAAHSADGLNSIGLQLMSLHAETEAEACYQQAIRLAPNLALPLSNLGNLRHLQHRFTEAESLHRLAVERAPDRAALHLNLGGALHGQRRYADAAASIRRALELEPDSAAVWLSLGTVYVMENKLQEAVDCLQKCLLLDPGAELVHGLLLRTMMRLCDWRDVSERMADLHARIRQGQLVSAPHETLGLIADPALLHQAATLYTRREFPAIPSDWKTPASPAPGRRLRIGLFSSDFRNHPVSQLLLESIEQLDRSRFELIAFSLQDAPNDPLQARARKAFDEFISADRLSDQQLTAQAREIRLDIAIDLNGYTEGARTTVFAQRVAPVQASFLGYAGSMGASYIDYLVADRFVVPPELERHYTEKLACMPRCFMPHDNGQAIPATALTRAQVGLPEAGVVFCCFNNHYKVTPECFAQWMRILSQVEASVLWLSDGSEATKRHLMQEARNCGVDPERLVFAPRIANTSEHLARIRLADLFLDTAPYNAHTTALDALWAGVPVLTCAGQTYVSRVAGSMLHTLGLYELITEDPVSYELQAITIGRDPDLTRSLRANLASETVRLRLFDTPGWTRDFEALLIDLATSTT